MRADPENRLSDSDITRRLSDMTGDWSLDGKTIVRIYKTANWKASLMLVNAIGFVCEAAWHHPDITLSWGEVRVSLWTHTAGGVTERDLEMAARIEALAAWAPQGDALTGIPAASPHAIFPPATPG